MSSGADARATWKSFKLYSRAFTAMYGSTLFWLGTWTFFQVDLTERTAERDSIYMAVGLFLLVISDSWYATAGIVGAHLPSLPFDLHPRLYSALGAAKLGSSFVGSVLFWLGLRNFVAFDIPPEVQTETESAAAIIKFWSFIFLGLLALVFAGTFFSVAGLTAGADIPQLELTHIGRGASVSTHLYHSARALLSVTGQVFIFFGVFHVTTDVCYTPGACGGYNDAPVWKPLFFWSTGCAIYFLFDSYLAASGVATSTATMLEVMKTAEVNANANINAHATGANGYDGRRRSSIGRIAAPQIISAAVGVAAGPQSKGAWGLLYLRSAAALLGSVLHNVSLWKLIDVYMVEAWTGCSTGHQSTNMLPCWARNLLFSLTGFAALVVTRKVHGYAGVTLSPVATMPAPSNRDPGVAQEEELRQLEKAAMTIAAWKHARHLEARDAAVSEDAGADDGGRDDTDTSAYGAAICGSAAGDATPGDIHDFLQASRQALAETVAANKEQRQSVVGFEYNATDHAHMADQDGHNDGGVVARGAAVGSWRRKARTHASDGAGDDSEDCSLLQAQGQPLGYDTLV